MKCFVASAFDRKDVDKIYDKIILPVLKKYSIIPLRVDRIEHNEDIDDKIFSLIEGSDFCIADLTYSRPSVYYEAGFIYGSGKPVIYIARSDHFKPKISDPEGILNIHFDLQMKNIIPWSESNFAFRKRLEKRLLKVIKPVINQKRINEIVINEEKEFNKLSLINKQKNIIANVKTLLKSSKHIFPAAQPSIINPLNSFYCFTKTKSLIFYATPTVTKTMLNDFRHFLSLDYDQIRINKIKELHLVYLVFKVIPQSRIMESYPWFSIVDDKVFKTDWTRNRDEIKIELYIHLIDGIKSISELNRRITSKIKKYYK